MPAFFGYSLDARKVWNFTASAPASAAISISFLACSRLPLWLLPASAMMKHASPSPTQRLPILIRFIGVPCASALVVLLDNRSRYALRTETIHELTSARAHLLSTSHI